MTLDHLLLWLSAKGSGSWSQFRSAVEELRVQELASSAGSSDEGEQAAGDAHGGADLPVYQHVRFALERLGHVEFFTRQAENGWRIVPPVLAFLADAPEQGLLCGARSPELLDDLHGLDGVDVMVSHSGDGPSRVLLRGFARNLLADRARELGLQVQEAASTAILSSLPGARDANAWHRLPLPETPGWRVHHFSASRLRWHEVSQADAANARNALFRFVMKHQRIYFLRWRGGSYRVPVQVGKYAVMHRSRGILRYETDRRMLTVPTVCRPPLLIERALILCSGFLPRFDSTSGRLEYDDVPPDVVSVVAQLLHQEVR